MTATIMPSRGEETGSDSYCLCLCCDMRSDDSLLSIKSAVNLDEIAKEWGGKAHWAIFDSISTEQISEVCPRCTYYEHNKILESCIMSDDMLLNFI